MPTTKTITPTSMSGDFNSFQDWWDLFAVSQLTADQWANVIEAGDPGGLDSGDGFYTAVPDSGTYPRIYASVPGVAVADGYVMHTSGYLRIEGMKITSTIFYRGPIGVAGGSQILDCVLDIAASGSALSCMYEDVATDVPIVVCNTVMTSDGSGHLGIDYANFNSSPGTLVLENCTIDNFAGNGLGISAGQPLTLQMQNTIVTRCGSGAFDDEASSDFSGCNNNACDDGTLTSVVGGSGNVDDLDPAAAYYDPDAGNLSVLPTGPLEAAGANLSSDFTRDILNRLRPATDAWDIGAYQGATAAVSSGSADYPADTDVRSGISYDSGGMTGSLDLPDPSNVLNGVSYDNDNETGTAPDLTSISSRLPAALVGGRMDCNVGAIDGSSAAATRLGLSAAEMIPGTVDATVAPTTTVFQAGDITEATADHYQGRLVLFTLGALAGQVAEITGYRLVSGRGQFTVSPLTGAPAGDDTFLII